MSFDMDLLYQSIILMRGSRCWWAVSGVASGETDDKTGGAGALGGIDKVEPGARIGDIGYAVEKVLRKGKLG